MDKFSYEPVRYDSIVNILQRDYLIFVVYANSERILHCVLRREKLCFYACFRDIFMEKGNDMHFPSHLDVRKGN